MSEWKVLNRVEHVLLMKGRSGRPSTSHSRKASSPQEYRNQLNDITNALFCKGTVLKNGMQNFSQLLLLNPSNVFCSLLFDSTSYNKNRPKRGERTFFSPRHLTHRKIQKVNSLTLFARSVTLECNVTAELL